MDIPSCVILCEGEICGQLGHLEMRIPRSSSSLCFFCFYVQSSKMWNKGLLLALSLLAAPSALAWDHAADVGSLKETLETNDFTLVACKSSLSI